MDSLTLKSTIFLIVVIPLIFVLTFFYYEYELDEYFMTWEESVESTMEVQTFYHQYWDHVIKDDVVYRGLDGAFEKEFSAKDLHDHKIILKATINHFIFSHITFKLTCYAEGEKDQIITDEDILEYVKNGGCLTK